MTLILTVVRAAIKAYKALVGEETVVIPAGACFPSLSTVAWIQHYHCCNVTKCRSFQSVHVVVRTVQIIYIYKFRLVQIIPN